MRVDIRSCEGRKEKMESSGMLQALFDPAVKPSDDLDSVGGYFIA